MAKQGLSANSVLILYVMISLLNFKNLLYLSFITKTLIMFIIFGWNHTKINEYGPVQEEKCQNCNNTEAWHLKKISKYFTLFFIPVFPHDSENFYHCPICNHGRSLSREDFMSYKEIADTNMACLEKKITEEERISKLDEIHQAKKERDRNENNQNIENSSKWTSIVAEKSIEELQNILDKKQEEYDAAFIIAAKLELGKRKGRS
jgi:hypothetical protein